MNVVCQIPIEEIEDELDFSIVLGLILFFSWIVLMRWLSGWGQLEAKWKCNPSLMQGQISRGSYRWVHTRVRFTETSLAVELYPTFFWMRPGFPLSLWLKPICIPWNMVDRADLKQSMLGTKVTVYLAGCSFRMSMRGRTGKHMYVLLQQAKDATSMPSNSSLDTDVPIERQST